MDESVFCSNVIKNVHMNCYYVSSWSWFGGVLNIPLTRAHCLEGLFDSLCPLSSQVGKYSHALINKFILSHQKTKGNKPKQRCFLQSPCHMSQRSQSVLGARGWAWALRSAGRNGIEKQLPKARRPPFVNSVFHAPPPFLPPTERIEEEGPSASRVRSQTGSGGPAKGRPSQGQGRPWEGWAVGLQAVITPLAPREPCPQIRRLGGSVPAGPCRCCPFPRCAPFMSYFWEFLMCMWG